MNRYLLIQRLRWPAMLILFGVNAMLHEWDILSFGKSWPLYLILWGIFRLAERAALSSEEYPGYAAANGSYPYAAAPYAAPGTAIVPVHESTPDAQIETPGSYPGEGRQ